MRELGDAIARAALVRVSVLREERLTREAQLLFDRLRDAGDLSLGRVPDNPERYSLQAALRERADLEEAILLMRQERRDAIERAREILSGIMLRIGPSGGAPYLDGMARTRVLSDLAIAFSFIGEERRAISISRFLLGELAARDPSSIAEYVLNDTGLRKQKGRVVVQLNNIAVRRNKLAYLAALGGDRATARDELNYAYTEASQALRLRDPGNDARAVVARLLSRALLARLELERAVLLDDIDEREATLAEVRAASTAVVSESYSQPAIRPKARLIRAGVLAMVLLEQALLHETRGEMAQASSLAWAARVGLMPNVDLWRLDADESPSKTIRYGDACRLAGATNQALRTWLRSRDRLALFRGESSSAVKALDARIMAIS
jgi:hypothetical protein